MSSRSLKKNFRFEISDLKLLVALASLLSLSACVRPPEPQSAAQAQAQSQQTQTQTQPQFERPAGVLRVCADPNNLPFSNERGEGFENKLAEMLAEDLGERLEYTWWAQRRGFFRNTLSAGACDVVLGVPASFELAATTAPYYRSTYVFVYRKGGGIQVHSFDDAVLRDVKVGVQLVGDDGANTPPAHALSARGVVANVRGYTLYGDYARPNPPARIVEAVAAGEVDVAVAWGPLAGYFARRQRVPLEVVPVLPQFDLPFLPFVYDISMGVRRGDEGLRLKLEDFIERRRPEIERVLDDYGVPKVKG
jgi:quinoprotein dehydrogenase-associated probable ABC transporter substrate-binding protein